MIKWCCAIMKVPNSNVHNRSVEMNTSDSFMTDTLNKYHYTLQFISLVFCSEFSNLIKFMRGGFMAETL